MVGWVASAAAEIPGSYPVIDIFIYNQLNKNCVKKTEIKKKEAGNGPI